MAYIVKRNRVKGTVYQVRYGNPERSITFDRRKDAQHFIENIPKDSFVHKNDSVDLKRAVSHWLEVCEKYGRKGRPPVEASTLRQYKKHAKILDALFGADLVSEYDEKKCLEVSRVLTDNYSRRYARKIFTSFKGVLSEAKHQKWTHENAATGIVIYLDEREEQENQIPSIKEVQKILKAAKADPLYYMIFKTMAATGMRVGETLGLPKKNVLTKTSQIRVAQDLNEDGTIGKLKTKASYRTIDVGKKTMLELKKWMLQHPGELVFTNSKGKPVSAANMNARGWQPALKEAGAKGFPPKCLRHVRASLEIADNANPKEVQDLMGHSNIQTTYNIYGHLFPEDAQARARRAQKIDKLLTNG